MMFFVSFACFVVGAKEQCENIARSKRRHGNFYAVLIIEALKKFA